MEYIIPIIVCVTIVILSQAHITININHKYEEHEAPKVVHNALTQEELDDAYDKHNINNFDDVIKSINAEFGGVDNGEDTTT